MSNTKFKSTEDTIKQMKELAKENDLSLEQLISIIQLQKFDELNSNVLLGSITASVSSIIPAYLKNGKNRPPLCKKCSRIRLNNENVIVHNGIAKMGLITFNLISPHEPLVKRLGSVWVSQYDVDNNIWNLHWIEGTLSFLEERTAKIEFVENLNEIQ